MCEWRYHTGIDFYNLISEADVLFSSWKPGRRARYYTQKTKTREGLVGENWGKKSNEKKRKIQINQRHEPRIQGSMMGTKERERERGQRRYKARLSGTHIGNLTYPARFTMKYREHCSNFSLSDVFSNITWSNLLHFQLIYYFSFTPLTD